MWSEISISIVILVGVLLFFAIIIVISYKKLKVEEDPRIEIVEGMLPGSNCGACGEPGCRAFAEKVIKRIKAPSKCTVSSEDGIKKIASFLGVDAGKEEKRIARLLCAGGIKEAKNTANYDSNIQTCRAAATVAGGFKECTWGCLGLGDCEQVCDFDAIKMNDNKIPVVNADLCTACGDCVDICPKDLFVIMPVSHKLIVQCKSLLEGDEALEKCYVACTGCGLCAADALPGVIEIKDNLAVINYKLNHLATPQAIKRCPTEAIKWIEYQQFEPHKDINLIDELNITYYQ